MISQVNSVWLKKPLDPLQAPLQSASVLLNSRVNSVPVPWKNGDSRSPFSWEYGNPSPYFLRPQVPIFPGVWGPLRENGNSHLTDIQQIKQGGWNCSTVNVV